MRNSHLKREIDQFTLDGKLIKTFESMTKAVEEAKISYASICLACRGRNKTGGGFIWKYNNEKQKVKTSPLDYFIFNENLSDDE